MAIVKNTCLAIFIIFFSFSLAFSFVIVPISSLILTILSFHNAYLTYKRKRRELRRARRLNSRNNKSNRKYTSIYENKGGNNRYSIYVRNLFNFNEKDYMEKPLSDAEKEKNFERLKKMGKGIFTYSFYEIMY